MLRALTEREVNLSRIVSGSSLYILSLIIVLAWAYNATLLPGIGYGGDTVKFQYLGKILGIPHPTGLPALSDAQQSLRHPLPFCTLAYKANLLSAVFAIAGCPVFFRLLFYLGLGCIGALALALSLGLSRILWSQALSPRSTPCTSC